MQPAKFIQQLTGQAWSCLSNRKEIPMLSKEALHKDIDAMPEEFTEEIYDFVSFLKRKLIKENTEAALLSESSLRKDWLSPEEDEAWKNL